MKMGSADQPCHLSLSAMWKVKLKTKRASAKAAAKAEFKLKAHGEAIKSDYWGYSN